MSQSRSLILAMMLFFCGLSGPAALAEDEPALHSREAARAMYSEGRYREALDVLKQLLSAELPAEGIDAQSDALLAQDYFYAVQCFRHLDIWEDFDVLVDAVMERHPASWRLGEMIIHSLLDSSSTRPVAGRWRIHGQVPRYGSVIDGSIQRGAHGDWINLQERDRVRALQHGETLLPHLLAAEHADAASVLLTLAHAWGQHPRGDWALQTATDLDTLPEPQPEPQRNVYHVHDHGDNESGAPVDGAGKPLTYALREDYAAAANDGERWRWLLHAAAQRGADRQASLQRAHMAERWFSVATLGTHWLRNNTEIADAQWQVASLSDDESIARLASGIQRFTLPTDYNYIRIYQELEDWYRLGQIFENRNQRPRAAEAWLRAGNGHRHAAVVAPWLRLGAIPAQVAGEKASLPLTFRNASAAEITVQPVRLRALADHVMATARDPQPDHQRWQYFLMRQLHLHLIQDSDERWLRPAVAQWQETLDPHPEHRDSNHHLSIPVTAAGAYLVSAQAVDGNISRSLLWLVDTVIVEMPVNDNGGRQQMFYVADAASGEAVADLSLQGFGHRPLRRQRLEDQSIETRDMHVRSDALGLIHIEHDDAFQRYNWLFMGDNQDRLAIWEGGISWHRWHQRHLRQHRAQVFTNRPLLRPGARVEGSVWAVEARYDEDHQPLLNQHRFVLTIRNAQGDEVHRDTYRSNRWGNFTFSYELGDDAPLGVYHIAVLKRGRTIGQGRFRVEEYRPPEFSVSVTAPSEPVLLGDTIRARVQADYLWGQPVRQAEVSYTVTRNAQTDTWFPPQPWDWLYGRGYWWHWRTAPAVLGNNQQRPEVVAQGQAQLDGDGGFDLAIDTALAKALFGEHNQRYDIQVEVRDASRRTEVGQGSVIASAEPFHLRAWTPPGYLRAGRDTTVHLAAQRADGEGIAADLSARLYRRSYGDDGEASEAFVHEWQQQLDASGRGQQRLNLARPGQYRLQVDAKDGGQTVQTSHLITVLDHGLPQTDPADFRFTALEVLPDQADYAPGEQAELLIASAARNATVLLFIRPENGAYQGLPEVLHLRDGAALHTLDLHAGDQPNIFVEAITVYNGQVHRVVQQLLLPPRKRQLDLTVKADASRMGPGEEGAVTLTVRDGDGQPVSGSAVVSIYDSALDLLASDMHPSPVYETFWKWTRNHHPRGSDSLPHPRGDLRHSGEAGWTALGSDTRMRRSQGSFQGYFLALGAGGGRGRGLRDNPPGAITAELAAEDGMARSAPMADSSSDEGAGFTPTLRQDFADSILWSGAVTLDENGQARLPFTLSDSLTTWQVRVAAIAEGAAVGEASTQIVAAKDLMLRLHAPRFATEGDQFVLSTSIHNDHPHPAEVTFNLAVTGDSLQLLEDPQQRLQIPAGGEQRLDIPVRAVGQGSATITAEIVGQVNGSDDGDALQRSIPIHIYGAETTEVASLVMAADQQAGQLTLSVPEERIPEASQLILRWSPSVAGAAIEAIPYLADYPYGCTEQTLNRFVPAVIALRLLQDLDIDLGELRERRELLNPGQLGTPQQRDPQHQRRSQGNPVFDPHEIASMVAQGVERLGEMQLSDGGWGWFSGYGEHSWPHTTAVVVRGLVIARDNGAAVPENMLEQGLAWLQRYQREQVNLLQRGTLPADQREGPYRSQAGNIDALVALIRQEASADDDSQTAMVDFLVRDRLKIAVYSQALLGLTLQLRDRDEDLAAVLATIRQYVEYNDDNHTAWLRLRSPWWRWYGAEFEAMSAYLKLLVASGEEPDLAQRLAKYLVNSRRGHYWNSTRDTAWAVEALVDYARVSGEMDPDLRLRISVDGEQQIEQHLTREDLFAQQSTLTLGPDALPAGQRSITIDKQGDGPLYVNAWLSVFTREQEMAAQGEEVQIQRSVWRIAEESRAGQQRGGHGQVVDVQEQDEQRTRLETGAAIHSGDLLEIELIIESANDYEYLMITDPKFAGSEPVEQRSGYYGGAFVEFRDDRVVHFLRTLPRGTRSLRYRVRAELPGTLNAMPAVISGMYAPELIGNSRNWRIQVSDQE